jgi:hypothetical protein
MVESKDIIAIIEIARKVTSVAKFSPFVFAVAYIITMICYIFCDDATATLLDQLCYTSPLVVIMNFRLSYSLKLCKWHRLECSLPMFPLIPLVIDYYIYPISRFGAIVNGISILTLIILSLVNAYFVFRKPKPHNTH